MMYIYDIHKFYKRSSDRTLGHDEDLTPSRNTLLYLTLGYISYNNLIFFRILRHKRLDLRK